MPAAKLSIQTLFQCRAIMAVSVAPDGRHAVATVRTPNAEKSRNETSLWLWDKDTDGFRQLTNGPADSSAAWLTSRTIVFSAAKRDEDEAKEKPFRKARLFTIDIDGGEPRLRAVLDGSVFEIVPSPDGKTIAIGFSPHPELSEFDKKHYDAAPPPMRPHRLRLRFDGMGELPHHYPSIYLLSAKGARWKNPVRVTNEPSGWDSGVQWFPDGKAFLFSRGHLDRKFSRADLFRSDLKGKLAQYAMPEGDLNAYALSPDGKQIAFCANDEMRHTGYLSAPLRLRSANPKDAAWTTLVHTDGKFGENAILGDNGPAGAGRLFWESDGTLLALHSIHGRAVLVRVPLEGGHSEGPLDGTTGHVEAMLPKRPGAKVTHPRMIGAVGGNFVVNIFHSAGGTTLYARTSPNDPGEVWRLGRSKPVSSLNRKVAKQFRIAVADRYVETQKGVEVHAFLWATNAQLAQRAKAALPLVVYIHGGPTVATGFGFLHEYSWLAEQGFPVLTLNPRGSTTYGDSHGEAIAGKWGDRDVHDILEVRKAILKAYPQFDPERTYIVGGSYGGYMANWMVTRHPGVFRAGISERCLSNIISFSGTSDFSNYFPVGALGIENLWADPKRAWENSPISKLDKVKEPLLILHSDTDFRCPVDQAEELYVGLVELGKKIDEEVKLVIFRGESHDLSRGGRPANRQRRLEHILDWLKKHNKRR